MIFSLIAAAIGIATCSRIIKFLCDELTEEEKAKQDELTRQFNEKQRETEQRLNKIEEEKKRRMCDIRQKYGEKYDEERERLEKEVAAEYAKNIEKLVSDKKTLNGKLIRTYLDAAKERKADVISLQGDINNAINIVRQQLKEKDGKTIARKNALQHFLHELYETREKSKAYVHYISNYSKFIQDRYHTDPNEAPELVKFILPENYLYTGKLIELTKEEIQQKNIDIPDCSPLKFCTDCNIDDIQAGMTIPMFCEQFPYRYNSLIKLSKQKGLIKVALANPHIGLHATVDSLQKNEYILTSKSAPGVMFRLFWRNLENPDRKHPIGAELRIFPIDWDIDLNKIYVSERAADALHGSSFDCLPVLVSENKQSEFQDTISNKRLLDSTDEWKIAPYKESELPDLQYVKLQLGTSIVFLASVNQLDDDCWFSYEGVLDYAEHSVKPEDIFAVIDCVLLCVVESDKHLINESIYANMRDLALFVFTDFRNQHSIKINHQGLLYYNKWAELLDKLITYKYKGSKLSVERDEIIETGKDIGISFQNPVAVNSFCASVYEAALLKRSVNFFIELELGKYAFVKKFSPARDVAYFDRDDKKAVQQFFKDNTTFTLYSQNSAYTETRQKRAINSFRMGELANHQLQVAAMDGSEIYGEPSGVEITDFVNSNISDDESQRETIKRAMAEKNIFMIQGPPGTGKTTVIVEIIKQMISNASCRILIVSQANVAVDNVLKRLVEEDSTQIIRCGNADRIVREIYPISYDLCYKNYIASLEEKKGDSTVDKKLLNRWLKFVAPERGSNPDIGEMILRSKKVVGATCIGLAKRGLGIDRITFDLVIVDEAGKALPGEILVPYIRAGKVLLIGDHKQLPPIIDPALYDNEKIEIDGRDEFEEPLFNESFFTRLWCNAPDTNKAMLVKQYRMPASIGQLISGIFYENDVINSEETLTKPSLIPKMPKNITMLDMSADIEYTENTDIGVTNTREAQILQKLLVWLKHEFPSFNRLKVAVITPYRAQKRLLQKAVKQISGNYTNVAVDTVDAFQGDEAAIVIYCTTRAAQCTRYFSDYRRVNVAISRAQNNLIIIGSLNYFHKYEKYKYPSPLPVIAAYIDDCKYGDVMTADFLNSVSVNCIDKQIDIISPGTIEITGFHDDVSDADFIQNLDRLREHFEKTGKLEKIKVKKNDDKYELVDGYSVLFFALQEGLQEVEVVLT